MKGSVSPWTRRVAGALAILMGLTFAMPCWAGEATTAAASGSTSLRTVADAKLATLDTSKGVLFAQAAGAAGTSESKPFLKTTKGVAVAVLMVGGLAWVVASRQSDKVVHSPAR